MPSPQQTIITLKAQVATLTKQVATLKAQVAALTTTVAARDATIVTLQAENVKLKADLAAAQASLAATQADLAATKAALAACQASGGTGDAAALAACQLEYKTLYDRMVARYGATAPLAWPLDGFAWDESHAGTPVDLSGYVDTFRDDFSTMSVTRKDGAGPWYAAVHSSFGAASLGLQPGDYYNPFSIVDNALRITMRMLDATTTPPNPGGDQWKGGYIQSVNAAGQGFSQGGGYFEARMRFPSNGLGDLSKAMGAWPAFWLLTNDAKNPTTMTRMEFDIVEAYGSDPKGLHSTLHYKPAGVLAPGAYAARQSKSNYQGLTTVKNTTVTGTPLLFGPGGNMFNGQYKTYAVKFGQVPGVDPTVIYVNGFEMCRGPTLPWMLNPVYVIVNLTRFGDDLNPMNPQTMDTDYVRVMARA